MEEHPIEFENNNDTNDAIPQWQISLVGKEIKNIKNGTAELLEWEKIKNDFIIP